MPNTRLRSAPARFGTTRGCPGFHATKTLPPVSPAKDPNALYMRDIERIYDQTANKRSKEEQYVALVQRQLRLGEFADCRRF